MKGWPLLAPDHAGSQLSVLKELIPPKKKKSHFNSVFPAHELGRHCNLVGGKCLLQQSGSSRSMPGDDSTSSQTHWAFVPLDPDHVVGMVQLRLCEAKQLETYRPGGYRPQPGDSVLGSACAPPLDKIPRARCGLLVSLPVRRIRPLMEPHWLFSWGEF